MVTWLSPTSNSDVFCFFGKGRPSASISSSLIMSASSSSLSSSCFLMDLIIALRLLPAVIRFQGAGRGVVSSSSSMASSALCRRRKAGVSNSFDIEDGVPASPSFIFFGVTNLSSRKRFPTDCGVFSPLALGVIDVSLSGFNVFRPGVWSEFGAMSTRAVLLLLGVCAGKISKRPRTLPSRCGVGPMNAGPSGEGGSVAESTRSGAASTPRFLFKGVNDCTLL